MGSERGSVGVSVAVELRASSSALNGSPMRVFHQGLQSQSIDCSMNGCGLSRPNPLPFAQRCRSTSHAPTEVRPTQRESPSRFTLVHCRLTNGEALVATEPDLLGAAYQSIRIRSCRSGRWSADRTATSLLVGLLRRKRRSPIATEPMNLHLLTNGLQGLLILIVALIVVYTVRHYAFTLNRLFGTQRHPYIDIDVANWPSVTVLVAAHNEELVIEGSLRCLMEVDYPSDRLTVMPMNDRSTDRTREIIDSMVALFPDRIQPFHRMDGKPGKAAALKDAMSSSRAT